MNASETSARAGPIVSSAHLVSGRSAELSEVEFGLNMLINAYQRWIVRCMAAAGLSDLGPLDVQVMHLVNHRDRRKKLSELCFLLNMDDSHTVNYALKKLVKQGLLDGEKRGKEIHYGATEAGREACAKYREVREACLIDSLQALGHDNAEIGQVAQVLRALSGHYDQAARSATAF